MKRVRPLASNAIETEHFTVESIMRKDHTKTPETPCPTLYDKCVGSYSPLLTITLKTQETGPTVYRPYPRRLDYLTI